MLIMAAEKRGGSRSKKKAGKSKPSALPPGADGSQARPKQKGRKVPKLPPSILK